MIDNLVMFPMFYHDGTLYTVGGLSSGSNVIPNLRMLNLESSSWTNGAAYSDSGFYAHCGILHHNRIFTFGGSRNVITYSKSVQIYDITSDSWLESSFSLPQGLRQMACSLVPGNGDWIPDLFLLAGGETGQNEYSNSVYSIDPTSNGEVKELLLLSMTVSRFGSQNSFAVFHENVVFLATGYGNGMHMNNTVFLWNRWDSNFNQYNSLINGREQPGNAMIPLRHIPVCGDKGQSQMWKIILNHEIPTRFSIGGWNENVENAQSSRFERLDEYRCEGGRYHFRLVYPELGTYNEWYQTNDPSNPEHIAVSGYLGVALGLPIGFNGLVYNNKDALMMGDSNTTHPQWFSVGRIKMDSSHGKFPGPPNCFVSKLQLFVRNDCATT
ncbi:hypothetical protein TCAL_08067 [Tigriopus californicus]|uniref:Uncharacterized protein n=2 Tax=Tigriopus californicus TaxID=6832 RepID=A0A553NU93_TIGCA|nr:hypothetical protein TCAL_08067 [Tigriopus californicus]